MSLPRKTYLTGRDSDNEDRVAGILADVWSARQFKIGVDDPKKEKPRFDRLFCNAHRLRCIVEIKGINYNYRDPRLKGHYTISQKKVEHGRDLHAILRVPVIIVTAWADGPITGVDVMEPHGIRENWGRTDRNDPADLETGAEFAWKQLKVLTNAPA